MAKQNKARSPVGKRLRERREIFELSQKQLGIQAGIDQFVASARINQYETNKHVPDFRTVEQLATVLEISPAYFYCEDNDLANLIALYSTASLKKRKDAANALKSKKNQS